ncbi:hypothetical protein BRADI_3g58032v3 [Brachypodium distachyon]|uniref:Uncharacterized protein n=1 Tax=Brachypodium distachyon TaxID=15368 RepID=A0A0Q3FRU8_BRADI|nr:hypothetical protein BRADI_3g58032v3 [Brachypodium distachyon]
MHLQLMLVRFNQNLAVSVSKEKKTEEPSSLQVAKFQSPKAKNATAEMQWHERTSHGAQTLKALPMPSQKRNADIDRFQY